MSKKNRAEGPQRAVTPGLLYAIVVDPSTDQSEGMAPTLEAILARWPLRSVSLQLLRHQPEAIADAVLAMSKFALTIPSGDAARAVLAVVENPTRTVELDGGLGHVDLAVVATDSGELLLAAEWRRVERNMKRTVEWCAGSWSDTSDREDSERLILGLLERAHTEPDADARRCLVAIDADRPEASTAAGTAAYSIAAWRGWRLDQTSVHPANTVDMKSLHARMASGGHHALLVVGDGQWSEAAIARFMGSPGRIAACVWVLREGEVPTESLMAALAGFDVPEGSEDPTLGWDAIRKLVEDHEPSEEGAVPGVVCFSSNGRRSVDGSGTYQNPARLGTPMRQLCLAARAFRASNGSVGSGLAEWFRGYGLTYAPDDNGLKAGDVIFKLKGVDYNASHHIKVDEARAWSQTGRIYFAIDYKNYRFIVHHVGGHL